MALFIGGPLDGQIIEVNASLDHVEVAIQNKLDTSLITKENNEPVNCTSVFYYKHEMLSCPTNVFSVFVPRSFTASDVLSSLIEGYHKSIHQNLSTQ